MTSHKKHSQNVPNIRGRAALGPRHSFGFRNSHRLRASLAAIICALLAFATSFAAATAIGLLRNKHVIDPIPIGIDATTSRPEDIYKGKTLNILVLGQDTREGSGNAAIGGNDPEDAQNHQSDTAMVAQISADRSYINLVSIPRDSLVNAPSCKTSKGELIPARRNVMFNSIFALGYQEGGDIASAAGCTLSAVNSLTGLDIQQFVIADFSGLANIINALGGVDLCIPTRTQDSYTGVNLTKGLHHLDGIQATQYARMRHGTASDGSDVMRTTRQQYLVKTLINEAKNKEVYSNYKTMYQLAQSSLDALQISRDLGSTSTLLGLADSIKDIDSSRIYARTLPVAEAASDINRVVWADNAQDVWSVLAHEKPLTDQELAKVSGTQAPSSQDPNADGTSPQAGTSTPSTAPSLPDPDPKTGLVSLNGELIDPVTGGKVDPETGTITDANTGQYIGIADRYLSNTVCAVPAQK